MGELTRRELIAGAGALALSPHMFWRQAKTKPVGWAILGLGGYSQYQIMPAFAHCEHSRIVGLVSGHADKLQRLGDRYGVPEKSRYSYETMDAMRDNPEIEAVYVITPPATHPKFTVRAAQAGKHVCSEKPMAPTPADCRKMIDACRKAGRLLQIGYRSHYETHNMRAIQACRSGELGHLKSIHSDHGFNMGPGTWRTQRALAGGGSMMDIGIYSLQALRYLSGEEPVEVTAKITNPPNDDRFKDVEDTVDFTLRFPSGLAGYGTSGYSWQPGKNRYEVQGDRHTLRSEPATAYGGNTLTLDGQPLPVAQNDQFAAQLDHFSQCIRNHSKVRTPGEEGLRDIRIVQAIYESARTGHPVRMHSF